MGEGSRPGVGARHEAGAEGPREYLGAGGSAPNPALTTHPYSMKEVIVVIMNVNDFVILPGSKPGTSVRLKAKTVRELQLEKAHLEMENEEMEKKLQQLQSNMNREKEERKTSSAYHWKSGRAGLVTTQARVLSRSKGNNNKVSSGKVKWQILKEQIQEPVKEPLKCEMASAAAHKKSEAKGMAHGPCEIKSALLTEADTRVGKSEVVDHFVKGINLNELKIIQEQKTVNSKHQVTSDKFSSLLVSVGSAEELSSASTCTSTEYHNKGLLLNGTFNEEESAESFQEALLQWRKGNRDHREKLCASGVLSESVGVCEVQTNLTVMKKPIQTEFKKGGLSYMEKLLLKKYRRAPVDQISVSCIKDLRPVLTLSVHQAMTGGGREGDDDDDDDVDDLTVEEVKRYWTSVVRKEVPDTVPESAESSLKIEFLEESYDKDLEESSNLLVTEAGAVGMNKQGKAEPLKQCGRNPVSSKEISQEKMVVCCCLERNVVQKESIKVTIMGRSLTSSKLPEKISNPTQLMSNKYLLETQLQKNHKGSQELDSVCNSQSLVLPVITKSSLLQDIAKRQKLVSTWYWGLEGFFVGVNPKRVMLEACSSLCADSIPMDCSISFPGDGRWFIERSLSEYADDTVVQGVLESQLNRPSSSLEAHRRISTLMAVWQSYPGNDSRGPWSTNMPRCKLTGNCPTSTQRKPKSSPLRVNTDIPKHKCNDVTKQDDYFWEYEADQVALLTLEKELQSYTGPEKHYLLTSKDVASSIRDSEKISRNTTDFHKNLKVTDHTGVDTLGGWDDQMEEEEILEDKQQVLALQ
ncbi:zinc finger B-box domain-containing protein 1 isoform X3 [Strigops habroptila]|uniref:zinc finger B-box domain-containing protein 1 isoform X3 n=2 Tax=Strigops habroptila TaxID=2489341 RepID=UPI0011CEFC17|nr:zinc finger B-box domain-containing protein 1 isoform X3 [Strigops habroptila]